MIPFRTKDSQTTSFPPFDVAELRVTPLAAAAAVASAPVPLAAAVAAASIALAAAIAAASVAPVSPCRWRSPLCRRRPRASPPELSAPPESLRRET